MGKRTNQFEKYLTQEDRLQISISTWISLQYPKLVWFHPPNEGKRTPFEQYKYKQLGALSGASDMILYEAKAGFHGFAIEIKVVYSKGKKNMPTPNQKAFLKSLHDRGWCTAIVWSLDEAMEYITDYMKGKKPEIKNKY